MKKRFICLIITIILALTITLPARAQTQSAFIIMHQGSGTVLSAENEDTLLPTAGLWALAPMLVLTEDIDEGSFSLDRNVSVSRAAASVPGSTAFIETNESISAEYLYKAAAMIGAGDAVYALCEADAGSSDKFTERINERLSELGVNAKYEKVNDATLMSARDIAKIASALCTHGTYLKYSSVYMDEITHTGDRTTELVNPNRLIRSMQGCKGLMTGSSNAAGYCGAFYTERQNGSYICVILGEKNSASRFERVQNETESCFSAYRETRLASKGEVVLSGYPVSGACVRTCELIAAADVSLLTEQGKTFESSCNLPDTLTAPMHTGDCVGNMIYTDESGNVLANVELTVKDDIEKAGFFDFFRMVAGTLLGRFR